MSGDPLMAAVAVAVAGKVVDGLAEGGRAALLALARLVRRRFRARAQAQDALAAAEAAPSDPERIRMLREQLEQLAAEDQGFAREVKDLWREFQSSNSPTVINKLHGNVNNLVQAQEIHGDDPNSAANGCPTVYLAEDGQFVIQGLVLDGDTASELEDMLPGEGAVRIAPEVVLGAVEHYRALGSR